MLKTKGTSCFYTKRNLSSRQNPGIAHENDSRDAERKQRLINFTLFNFGGDDCRNFEPLGRLNYSNVDKIIRNLRQMYQEKPESFEVPTFAQKQY